MNADEIREAARSARWIFQSADDVASSIAGLLVDRLKKVDKETLCKLKRELRGFNCHKRECSNK